MRNMKRKEQIWFDSVFESNNEEINGMNLFWDFNISMA